MDAMPSHSVAPAMNAKHRPTRGIGWAIRKVRKAQGKTLLGIATGVGSDPGNISRIETGKQEATESLLRAISAELGVSMSDLWQIAETGAEDHVGIAAKVGLMEPTQVRELDRYADYLLSQAPRD